MAHFYDPEPVPGGKSYGVKQDRPCGTCGGTGKVVRPAAAGLLPVSEDCPTCKGTGRVDGGQQATG